MTNQEWIKLASEKEEIIIEKMEEAHRAALNFKSGSGWFTGVIMDDEGDVYTSGPDTQNTTSGEVFDGRAIYVATFDTYNSGAGFETNIILEGMEQTAKEKGFIFPEQYKEMEEAEKLDILESYREDTIDWLIDDEVSATDYDDIFQDFIRNLGREY